MGDLWAVLVFALVIVANAVSSYNKNQREKQKRQTMLPPRPQAPKPQPSAVPQPSRPAPAPKSQTPQRTLFPERKTSPQNQGPRPDRPGREAPNIPPRRPAAAPSPQRPAEPRPAPEPEAPQAPDWGEIFGDAFKGLEEVLRGPQSTETIPAPAPPRQRGQERKVGEQRARTDGRRRRQSGQRQRQPDPACEFITKEVAAGTKSLKQQPAQSQELLSGHHPARTSLLFQPETLKQAIILSEIIGPPIAKRPRTFRRM